MFVGFEIEKKGYHIEQDEFGDFFLYKGAELVSKNKELNLCVGELIQHNLDLKRAVLNYTFLIQRLEYLLVEKGKKAEEIPNFEIAPAGPITIKEFVNRLEEINDKLIKV